MPSMDDAWHSHRAWTSTLILVAFHFVPMMYNIFWRKSSNDFTSFPWSFKQRRWCWLRRAPLSLSRLYLFRMNHSKARPEDAGRLFTYLWHLSQWMKIQTELGTSCTPKACVLESDLKEDSSQHAGTQWLFWQLHNAGSMLLMVPHHPCITCKLQKSLGSWTLCTQLHSWELTNLDIIITLDVRELFLQIIWILVWRCWTRSCSRTIRFMVGTPRTPSSSLLPRWWRRTGTPFCLMELWLMGISIPVSRSELTWISYLR